MSIMSLSECLRFCKLNRWSDSAVNTICIAEANARQRGSEHIDTGHLLLALVSDDNSASLLINEHDKTALVTIAAKLDELLDTDYEPRMCTSDDLLLTPRTEKAVRTVTDLPVATVGCEHILVVMLLDAESVAYQVLLNEGFTYERLTSLTKRINSSDKDFQQ